MSASVPADLPAGDSLADSPLGIPSLAARSRSVADVELARLLEHPAIWRGRSAARAESLPTGFGAIDSCLPGGGWPRTGLIEILVSTLRRRRVVSAVSRARRFDPPAAGALVCLDLTPSGAVRAGTHRAWRGSRAYARGATERDHRGR